MNGTSLTGGRAEAREPAVHGTGDPAGRPETWAVFGGDREAVRPRLAALPERERTILYMRCFGDMTQCRIAEQLGISQMHVSRLINRCCNRLRKQILNDAV
ncbi:sigma-70 family RNA polymerase sigma factor [Streptomyces humidus]|nr:sigma-70 family RNA polymerase sigma factor [Streptomyces humidus]